MLTVYILFMDDCYNSRQAMFYYLSIDIWKVCLPYPPLNPIDNSRGSFGLLRVFLPLTSPDPWQLLILACHFPFCQQECDTVFIRSFHKYVEAPSVCYALVLAWGKKQMWSLSADINHTAHLEIQIKYRVLWTRCMKVEEHLTGEPS